MINTIKDILKVTIIGAVLMLSANALVSVPANAQNIKGGIKCGAEVDLTKTSGCAAPAGTESAGKSMTDLVTAIINILSVIVGVVAVIMIIIGGFKYITSSGDSNNVASAKNTIIYALVGLIIVALAQVIVRFVLSALN